MKEQITQAIRAALSDLREKDGHLFNCPIEDLDDYDARKLHEVCINHQLSNHLEFHLLGLFEDGESLFFDIEFNREGGDHKTIYLNNSEAVVRPDIIFHNRKSGDDKRNILIVECKKEGSSHGDISNDKDKIEAFIQNDKYSYEFGLQVIYGARPAMAHLFSYENKSIERCKIEW